MQILRLMDFELEAAASSSSLQHGDIQPAGLAGEHESPAGRSIHRLLNLDLDEPKPEFRSFCLIIQYQ